LGRPWLGAPKCCLTGVGAPNCCLHWCLAHFRQPRRQGFDQIHPSSHVRHNAGAANTAQTPNRPSPSRTALLGQQTQKDPQRVIGSFSVTGTAVTFQYYWRIAFIHPSYTLGHCNPSPPLRRVKRVLGRAQRVQIT
jgi:hypothetical protein